MNELRKQNMMRRFLMKHYSTTKHHEWGRSPLDIPARSVVLSFFIALGIAYIAGNLITQWLWWRSKVELQNMRDASLNKVQDNYVAQAIIRQLLPNQTFGRIDIPEDDLKKSFKDGITALAIYDFFQKTCNLQPQIEEQTQKKKCDISKETFTSLIVGELSRKWFLLPPVLEERAEKEILDALGILESFQPNSNNDPAEWRRNILISGISQLRARLNQQIFPRRLLQGLAGYIQWMTFMLAIWCLVLLVLFRLPWAKIADVLDNQRTPAVACSIGTGNLGHKKCTARQSPTLCTTAKRISKRLCCRSVASRSTHCKRAERNARFYKYFACQRQNSFDTRFYPRTCGGLPSFCR